MPIQQHHLIGSPLLLGAGDHLQRLLARLCCVHHEAHTAQQGGQYGAGAGAVVGYQHAAAAQIQAGQVTGSVPAPAKASGKPEGAALARFALHPYLASHQLSQFAGDGESEAGAAVLAGGGAVRLLEGLEQPLLLFLAHADPRVLHRAVQQHLLRQLLQAADLDQDLALFGELDRVVGVVDQDLAEAQRIAIEQGIELVVDLEQQLYALGFGLLAHQGRQVFQYMVEIEFDPFQIQLAGLDLGEVEDVVDDAEQVLGGALDLAHVVELLRVEPGLQGEVGHAEDGVHGGADLVAHVGEKIALGPGRALRQFIGLFQLLILGLHHGEQLFPGRLGELLLHLLQHAVIRPVGQVADQGDGTVRVRYQPYGAMSAAGGIGLQRFIGGQREPDLLRLALQPQPQLQPAGRRRQLAHQLRGGPRQRAHEGGALVDAGENLDHLAARIVRAAAAVGYDLASQGGGIRPQFQRAVAQVE
ncbi:hypothetical protein D3C84_477390 [compost metagenome]